MQVIWAQLLQFPEDHLLHRHRQPVPAALGPTPITVALGELAVGVYDPFLRLFFTGSRPAAMGNGYVLHYAGEVPENKGIVSMLIQYGALDPHVRTTNDLSRQFLGSVFLADASRVQALLDKHPHLATSVDGRGDQPIHHAARNGDTEIVHLLIAYGADSNVTNERGHTVLYCAGGHGHLETVKLLLDNGADPEAKFTDDGKTLMEWLAQFPDDTRYTDIAEALRRHKERPPQFS